MKRSRISREDAPQKGRESGPGQVGSGKRERTAAHPAAAAAHATYASQLDSARLLLDRGLSREAEAQLTQLIKSSGNDDWILAEARGTLSTALAMEGRFNDSLSVIQLYEQPEARDSLDAETDIRVRVQLGLAFNYTGDFLASNVLEHGQQLSTPLSRTWRHHDSHHRQRGAVYRPGNQKAD